MSTAVSPDVAEKKKKKEISHFKPAYLGLAFAVLIGILLLPLQGTGETPLTQQGHVALALLGFAVILWVTEAVSYPISAIILTALIAILIGLTPSEEDPSTVTGTSKALGTALDGFSSSSVALVAAALMLAAAMQVTGLHRRIALGILRIAGEKTSHVLVGTIMISIVLAFFVPSATARGGAILPILLGMIAAFGAAKTSNLAALLVICAVQSISIWNVGIKTAAAQNLVAIGFIEESLGVQVTWGQWFLWAAPWSILMSIALYFIMRMSIKPETDRLAGGRDTIKQQLAELGRIKREEIVLIVVSVLLLLFWATEGILQPIDSATITVLAIGVLLIPRVGVFNSWKDLEQKVDWGTLLVFAIGISLGSLLLKTGAAQWLSNSLFGALGIENFPLLATIALVTAFTIVIHLGFASATSLASALIPIYIALAATLPVPDQGLGFIIIQQFVISFGFLLPVSAPQNMLAYGTGTFTTKQFLKVGIPLTLVGYVLVLIFSATYWNWMGLV
jgi:anion transporter